MSEILAPNGTWRPSDGTGTSRNDFMRGTADADTIHGLAGNDQILGLDGDDTLDGGEGSDFLRGLRGDDILVGGTGNDLMRGGSGDDVLDGGEGFDRVSNASADLPPVGVVISLQLQGSPQNTGHGWDTLIGIEAVSGTAYGDILSGDEQDNWLWGGERGGADTISAHGGNDLVTVGAGDHSLDGGDGTDTLSLSPNPGDIATDGAAVSLLLQGAAQDTRQGVMSLTSFENLSGSHYDDELTGNNENNVLAGDEGHDTLVGAGGNDLLLGDGAIMPEPFNKDSLFGPVVTIADATGYFGLPAGNDVLVGGEGDDVVQGGGGDDLLRGEEGDDLISGDKGYDLLDGGGGDDILTGGANRDAFEIGSASGHDTITDFDRADEIILFRDVAGVDDFSDLSLTLVGTDTFVSWAGGTASITLLDVRPNQLTAEHFEFAGAAEAAMSCERPCSSADNFNGMGNYDFA